MIESTSWNKEDQERKSDQDDWIVEEELVRRGSRKVQPDT